MSDSQLRIWCHAHPSKAADEIVSLRAQLSAARAEAEQARGKAIEEAAGFADKMAVLAKQSIENTRLNAPCTEKHISWLSGRVAMANELASRFRALSTATTPKGEE